MTDENTAPVGAPEKVSIQLPVETLIEFLNALHNANTDGAVATRLANALAAQKIQNRDSAAEADPTTHFTEQTAISAEEKSHLAVVRDHFSGVLNAVCCHKKGTQTCQDGQPPCPGDPIP